jgi:hypothetical protein
MSIIGVMGFGGRYRRWERDRALAGQTRAGSWARGEARRRQYDYVRRAWRTIAIVVALMAALTAVMCLFAPSSSRDLVVGLAASTTVWMLVLAVILGSGTAPMMMGDTGEQWTASELRRLRRGGWRVMHHAILRAGDIDHIAIGPAGVVVAETTWRSNAWDDKSAARAVLADAVEQARSNARDVSLTLRSKLHGAPVRAVVVLWSAAPRSAQRTLSPEGDVVVLYGWELHDWLAAHADSFLSRAEVDTVWDWLATQVAARDVAELERNGPPPRTVSELVLAGAHYLVGAALGFLVAGAVVARVSPWLYVPAGVVLTVGGAAARRADLTRRAAAGWLFGVVVAATIVLAVFAAFAVT